MNVRLISGKRLKAWFGIDANPETLYPIVGQTVTKGGGVEIIVKIGGIVTQVPMMFWQYRQLNEIEISCPCTTWAGK